MPPIEYTISEKIILEEFKEIKNLSEITINALYRTLPNGQRNYGKMQN